MIRKWSIRAAIAVAIVLAGVGVTLAAGGSGPDAPSGAPQRASADRVMTDPHGARIAKGEMDRILRAADGVTASAEKAELEAEGERLFNSATVAKEGESCASCHTIGGGVNSTLGVITHERNPSQPLSPDNFTGVREAPALWGVADTAPYNWIGTNPTLESQSTAAIKTHFVDEVPKPEDVAAITAYMKTIKPPASRQDQGRLTPKELAGEEIFVGKGGCIACHSGSFFTDNQLHLINVPQNSTTPLGPANDPGNPNVPGAFNTPTLRDVRNTAPYMHNGNFKTLEEVVRFYNTNELTGGPLRLTGDEIDELVAYLKSL